MEQYEHITKMENIMDHQNKLLEGLDKYLEQLDACRADYEELLEYYYSEQRNQDLAEDEAGKIPQDLKRGVLGEDDIFDLVGDYRDTALRMIEVALEMLKA